MSLSYRVGSTTAEWTDLDPAHEVVIQRIGTGAHTLEIQARTLTGQATATYQIVRPPYWYVSGWAYGTYAFLFAGLGVVVVLWRTRRLAERAATLERRVAERTAELKKANEAKDEFLASMSHEIRNPLNGVIGLSSMLRESVNSERDRRLTESLHACADQLRLVLDDVLDFAVIERGEVHVQAAPFRPQNAIRAAVLAVDPKLERTRLSFAPTITAALCLTGDEGKVRQIVSNLVSNAHKYGVPPEADISADWRDGRLIVGVANTGPDISPADQARIFGSFERGRSASHKYVRGAGLGLTICARFARAMGGDVTVQSQQGLTRFTFSASLSIAAEGQAGAPAAPPLRGTALAIEDEPYNRLVLGHVLTGLGLETDWAQNGTEALEIIRSGKRYDVILTDWMLPDIPGADLVRAIRAHGGETTPPIIAVTAYATAEKRAEAFAAGVRGFVTKPVTPEKLETALRPAVDHAAALPAETAAAEPLRLGVLVDRPDAPERLNDFRIQLLRAMSEIDRGLRQEEQETTARAAHRLASQVLAIHHHTLAGELRAIEAAVGDAKWDAARELHARNVAGVDQLCSLIDRLIRERSLSAPKPGETARPEPRGDSEAQE